MALRGSAACLAACLVAAQAAAVPGATPVPRLQAVPEPDYQVSFERDEREIVRYYFSPNLNRPFVYPLIGP